MDTQTIKDLFVEIASIAMEKGKEILLEKSKSEANCEVLGPISKSTSLFDGLALHVYSGLPEADDEEDDEDHEEG